MDSGNVCLSYQQLLTTWAEVMRTGANDLQREETEMAIQSQIPVSFEAFFPRGAFVVGEVEPIVKWSDDGQRHGRDLDKVTDHPLWRVRVIDADPE